MTDPDSIQAKLEEIKWRYAHEGLLSGERAYEYGLTVVRNAFWVAGGGLFFVPTAVSLSEEVERSYAFVAGLAFGFAVILTLLGNYTVHINWSLQRQLGKSNYLIRRKELLPNELLGQDDGMSIEKRKTRSAAFKRWIKRTFWITHVLCCTYVLALSYAFLNLYWAFGIFFEGVQ